MSAKPNKSTIKTKNSNNNTIYVLKNDHSLCKRLADIPQPESTSPVKKPKDKSKEKKKAAEQLIGDMELEQTGGYQEPHEKYFTYPRFFVV